MLANNEIPAAGQVTVRPDGTEVPSSVTAPAKLYVPLRLTVRETPDWPALMFVVGIWEREKSPT